MARFELVCVVRYTIYRTCLSKNSYLKIGLSIVKTLNCSILGKRSVLTFSRLRGRDVRDSLPYRAPLYPPCVGHVILRPCVFGSLMCIVLCLWAKGLLVPSPFTLSMLTS